MRVRDERREGAGRREKRRGWGDTSHGEEKNEGERRERREKKKK